MFIAFRNPEEIQARLIEGFKECRYNKAVDSSEGKKWIHLGTVQGKLNETALKSLKINYWMSVILTLGLALLLQSVQEMRKTVQTGIQERKILVEPENSAKISEAVAKIFAPVPHPQDSTIQKTTPLIAAGEYNEKHPDQLEQIQPGVYELAKKKEIGEDSQASLEKLKKLDLHDQKYEEIALKALEDNAEEVVKYIATQYKVDDSETLDKVFNKAFLRDPALVQFFPIEATIEVMSSDYLRIKRIPTHLPNYKDLIFQIADSLPSFVAAALDLTNPLLKTVFLEKLKNNPGSRLALAVDQLMKRCQESEENSDLLAELAIESVKAFAPRVFQSILGMGPFGIVLTSHKRYKEIAIAAVKANPLWMEKINDQVQNKEGGIAIDANDYVEIAAECVLKGVKDPNLWYISEYRNVTKNRDLQKKVNDEVNRRVEEIQKWKKR